MLSTYLSYQLISRDISKSLDRVETQPMVQRETDYYLENIGKVTSIDEFVDNDRLFKYAMKAYGLGDMDYAKAFMKKALTEGIEDKDSFANTLTDKRYYAFVKAFNFEKNGPLTTSYTAAQNYVPSSYASQIAVGVAQNGFSYDKAETSYYLTNISSVSSIDDLMGDERLLTYAMSAFGLDAENEPPERVRQMLEGGASDPLSPANTEYGKKYAAFVAAFDFVEYGDQTTMREAAKTGVPSAYMARSGLSLVKASSDYIASETKYFTDKIGAVKSIDDLMDDKRLLSVALSAYGLDPDIEDPKIVRQMLEGGSGAESPANTKNGGKYAAFVAAFDFEQYGEATTSREAVKTQTPFLYKTESSLGLIKPNATYVATETAYYAASVATLQSVDDLLADKRMLSYALTAFGFDPASETQEHLRTLLEGGVADPASLANTEANGRYADFVTSFNFAEYGERATTANPTQQATVDQYLRQTLEETEGEKNEGVRLALYFQRKAPELTNYYAILGDTALAQVVRTALGLPASMAQANIDKQVALMQDRFDLEDFKDPEKLGEFLQRFTTMWEIDNPSASSAQSSVAALFSMPVEYGVSTNLLLSLQQLKR